MYSYIVAEIGVNHNGDLERAKQMVEKALLAGADCVKFQTFWGLAWLEKYEFTKEQWQELKAYCDSLPIDFMTSAHWGSPVCGYNKEDYEAIDFVDTLVKTHKIASPYLTNENYLRHINSKGKPVFLSTGSIVNGCGMANVMDIRWAIGILKDVKVTLLHCVSKYPAPSGEYHQIKSLKQLGFPVGISDHTQKTSFPPLPVIEKHFKIDEDCIDANVSLNPDQFSKMVNFIRTYEGIYEKL
jgi:sialic acid synthase SpsE